MNKRSECLQIIAKLHGRECVSAGHEELLDQILDCLINVDQKMREAAEQACIDDNSFPSSGVFAAQAALQSVRSSQ